ncbi:hypothetical protein [Rhizobium sp. FY34]|uniref:hypothetical protein n=1 Tax=Rhizobium sp. FY34 TaxID=2562309 RepID=UPI001484E3F6|nr:hypothetical protein [Rhizobium sp. FY34]
MASYFTLEPPARPGQLSHWLAPLLEGVGSVALACAMVALPIVAHASSPMLGYLMASLVMGATAWLAPAQAIVCILFGFIFQNLIVSLLSGSIGSADEFDIIRAYNFLNVCIVWLVLAIMMLARLTDLQPMLRRILFRTTVMLCLIGAYFAIGFVLYGMGAVINLRNVVTPTLLFQICLVVFALHQVRLGAALSAMGMLVMLCGFVEFFYRDAWLSYTNSAAYWDLSLGANWETLALDKAARETGIVATGLTDTFRISFFNSPFLSDLGIEVMRLFGPNMHAISFAYCISFFALFALYRGAFFQAGLLVILMLLCSVKGPLIAFIMVGFGWIVFALLGARIALFVHLAAAFAFAIAGILLGLQVGDYHVLGLISGLREFFGNPLGYGIGAGGNLSPLFITIDWYQAQAQGYTPFPVESSVGVMLYQMGVFALVIIAGYAWIAWLAFTLAQRTGNALHAAVSLCLIWMLFNGLFQEEAYFAPLALASLLGLTGMMLGAGIRTGVLSEDAQR